MDRAGVLGIARKRRTQQPQRLVEVLAVVVVREKPEPKPITESTNAGASTEWAKASRLAMPPNSTGFSAMWWTMSGRTSR